jgi:hypothetical protein
MKEELIFLFIVVINNTNILKMKYFNFPIKIVNSHSKKR